jgi:hypothetical protein
VGKQGRALPYSEAGKQTNHAGNPRYLYWPHDEHCAISHRYQKQLQYRTSATNLHRKGGGVSSCGAFVPNTVVPMSRGLGGSGKS